MVPVLVATNGGDGKLLQDEAIKEPTASTSTEPNNKVVPVRRPPLSPENYLTHQPKDSRCEICVRCKAQRKQCRRAPAKLPDDEDVAPTTFGQIVTADHIIIGNEEGAGRKNHRSSLAILDRGTDWIGSYPTQNHTTAKTKKALQEFAGPLDTVDRFYTDGAQELGIAGDELGWRHGSATPYRPQTMGCGAKCPQNH